MGTNFTHRVLLQKKWIFTSRVSSQGHRIGAMSVCFHIRHNTVYEVPEVFFRFEQDGLKLDAMTWFRSLCSQSNPFKPCCCSRTKLNVTCWLQSRAKSGVHQVFATFWQFWFTTKLHGWCSVKPWCWRFHFQLQWLTASNRGNMFLRTHFPYTLL